jgi:hypothetical protein
MFLLVSPTSLFKQYFVLENGVKKPRSHHPGKFGSLDPGRYANNKGQYKKAPEL